MDTNLIIWLSDYIANKELPGYDAHLLMTHKNRYVPQTLPSDAKTSAVLLLLYPVPNDYNIVLIQRSKDGSNHSGQIAFPGGKVELEDESLWHTAIRESLEEIDLKESVDFVGAITPLYIPVSNYNLHPYIGFCPVKPSLLPSDHEVAQIIEIPLSQLFATKAMRKIWIQKPMQGYLDVLTYPINDELYVWGATAMVLAELEVLYKKYLDLK